MMEIIKKSKFIKIVSFMIFLAILLTGTLVTDDDLTASGKSKKHGYECNDLKEIEENHMATGVMMGSVHGMYLEKHFPGIKVEYYNTFPDMLLALENEKVDAIVADNVVLEYTIATQGKIRLLDDKLEEVQYSYVFPKTEEGKKLEGEISKYIKGLKKDGALKEIGENWIKHTDDTKIPFDYTKLPAKNGTIKAATNAELKPFSFLQNGKPSGLDIDILARFCKDNGYALEVLNMNFEGLLPAISSSKADVGGSGINITEERKESVRFSYPYYEGFSTGAVQDKDKSWGSLFSIASLKESIEKTFIREDRYKLIIDGVLTTLFITLMSILFGTLLGFLIYMLCRKGNKIANAISSCFMWIMEGLPAVVLLMILFYVVLAKLPVSGVFVSIVAFTLVFASNVNALVKSGVDTIDNGQAEASYALGFSDLRTFFKIVLPQAAVNFMPAYRSAAVSLVKATAIVGYIAVEDLTKKGDLIRSITYEAFFPLIAVALIYFALAALIIFIINRITGSIDPKNRSKEEILKGIDLSSVEGGEAG